MVVLEPPEQRVGIDEQSHSLILSEVVQRLVEVRRDIQDLIAGRAGPEPPSPIVIRNEPQQRLVGSCDDDFLTRHRPLDELGELRLGLSNVVAAHMVILFDQAPHRKQAWQPRARVAPGDTAASHQQRTANSGHMFKSTQTLLICV